MGRFLLTSLWWVRYIAFSKNRWSVHVFALPQTTYQPPGSKCYVHLIYWARYSMISSSDAFISVKAELTSLHETCSQISRLSNVLHAFFFFFERLLSKFSIIETKFQSFNLLCFEICFALVFHFGFCFFIDFSFLLSIVCFIDVS